MAIDWTIVDGTHIRKACESYDSDPSLRPIKNARNTFLLINNKKYPAKFIRGQAYKVATGNTLNPSTDYSGGIETVHFFENLGFNTVYSGKILNGDQAQTKKKKKVKGKDGIHNLKSDLNPKKQKIALEKLLKKHYGKVETESTFNWLEVPDKINKDPDIGNITKALIEYRGYKNYFTPKKKLKCDFYIPSINTIIEYDERQHFTIPRDISLSHYPTKFKLGFDIPKWRSLCQKTRAIDSSPKYRDEQRAIYDSLRDILATRNEVPLIRIEHGKIDWESKKGEKMLKSIIDPSSKKTNIRIGRVVMDFGIASGEWRALKEKYGWEYRLTIIGSHYKKNALEYKKRVKKLLQTSLDHECDIVVFPACSFLYENDNAISYYKKNCKKLPLVISGFLDVKAKKESAEILQFGKSLEKLDNTVKIFNTGLYSILVAISSNITKIYKDHKESVKGELKERIKVNTPALIFMLGHQQYVSPRIKMRLDKVRREMNDLSKRKKAIIVPYWRWSNSKANYEFYEPKLPWVKYSNKVKRLEENFDQAADYVDILDISL